MGLVDPTLGIANLGKAHDTRRQFLVSAQERKPVVFPRG